MPTPTKGGRRHWRWGLLLLLSSLFAAVFLGILRWPNPKLGVALDPTAVIAHPEVNEASGLVQSAIDPARFWVHNDSGDRPRIFAITLDGEVIVPSHLTDPGVAAHPPTGGDSLYGGVTVQGATLRDWEDITRIGERLYIAEMGNNLNASDSLGVYELVEPDPKHEESVEAAAFIPVRYPDQSGFPPLGAWNFDCEAIFGWDGKLYFVTKNRPAFRVRVQAQSANLYRLDSMDPSRVNILTRVDHIDDLGGWVTAADVSADGRYLAVLIESPVQSVWLFEKPLQGDRWFSETPEVRRFVFHAGGQIESVAFFHRDGVDDEIVLLNEAREIFRVPLERFQRVDRAEIAK